MEIIEQRVVGKHNQEDCEDGIVATNDFVAVIDGSTSKTLHRINPAMRNGRYAMTVIARYISHMAADTTLEQFCQGITAHIHSLYTDPDRMAAHPEERLCASAVIYSVARKEIWMIGDCQCMVDGILYTNGKPSEATIAEKRANLFPKLQKEHPDMTRDGHIVTDFARQAILPELVASMQGENKTYAVIDGFPIYMGGVKKISVGRPTFIQSNSISEEKDGGVGIVLASDGYPFLCSTLGKSETKLRKQLENDPYNINVFKATKGLMESNVSFDDRAYIRFTTAKSQRYFIWLSFDGTSYHGWQIQPNGESVQGKLQDALSKILRQAIEVTGAGRTDAGVHARTMVCHFDTTASVVPDQLCFRLNRLLPADISCHRIELVNGDLHARFSARSRTYRYFIHTDKDPFNRHYSVETHYPLDFALMNEAAEYLLTVSDFKAFCKAGADNKTTRCNVTVAKWVATSSSAWYFEITADRFLRNMVRAVVGTLFEVGRKRMSIEAFKQVVGTGTRSDAGDSMPAKGLFLWEIKY